MTTNFTDPGPHVASVDIGFGRIATVRARVDPATHHADVIIAVGWGGRVVHLEVDWNELLNSSGSFLYEGDGISLLLTENTLYDLETATWRLLSAQGYVPTEWRE